MEHNIFPNEIVNLVYKYRGIYLLQDKLEEYSLDYKKFCDFLIKYNGFTMGSFTLSCFDNSFTANDLDIFVYIPPREDYRCVYKDFFNVINKTDINIYVEKKPISNSSIETDPSTYLYRFHALGRKIDITVTNKKIDEAYVTIQCSHIVFNGIDWKIPNTIEKNIQTFLIEKKCLIGGNPYLSYFSDIYDPWHFDTEGSLISYSKLLNLSEKYDIKDESMKLIYSKLSSYYQHGIVPTDYSGSGFTKYYLGNDNNWYQPSIDNQVPGFTDCDDWQAGDWQDELVADEWQTGDRQENNGQAYGGEGLQDNLLADEWQTGDRQENNGQADWDEGWQDNLLADQRQTGDRQENNGQLDGSDDQFNDNAEIWSTENTFPPSCPSGHSCPSGTNINNNGSEGWAILDENPMIICPDNYLNVAEYVFKNLKTSSKELDINTFKKMFNIYKAWYRILKYISRGYIFTDINYFLNLEFSDELFVVDDSNPII
jgi:hypothetical protein